jgi:hypothetical protein
VSPLLRALIIEAAKLQDEKDDDAGYTGRVVHLIVPPTAEADTRSPGSIRRNDRRKKNHG